MGISASSEIEVSLKSVGRRYKINLNHVKYPGAMCEVHIFFLIITPSKGILEIINFLMGYFVPAQCPLLRG